MSLRVPHPVVAILLILWIGGCANTTVSDQPMRMSVQADHTAKPKPTRYINLAKGFDQSLTEAERKAIISELVTDRERAQQARLR